MASREPLISYRTRLLLATVVATSALAVVLKVGNRNPELLAPPDLEMPRALLSRSDPDPTLIILGNSSVAGVAREVKRLRPEAFIETLPMGGGNLLSSMTLASQSLVLRPKLLVVDLTWADMHIRPHSTPIAIFGADRLEPYLPKALFEKLRSFRTWRFELFHRTLAFIELFDRFLKLTIGTSPYGFEARATGWRNIGLDPGLKKRDTENEISLKPYAAELLRGLDRLARDGGARLVIILSPFRMYSHENLVNRRQSEWRDEALKTLKAVGIPHFDYSGLFFDGQSYLRGYFRDHDHLTSRGNARLAARLLNDLSSRSILELKPVKEGEEEENERDPCAADASRFCPAARGSQQEICLLENFDALDGTCQGSEWISRSSDPCYADRLRLCPGVKPESWSACLSKHLNELSSSCRGALKADT